MPKPLSPSAYDQVIDRFLTDVTALLDVDGVPYWFGRAAVDGLRARLAYELLATRQLGRDVSRNGEAHFVAGRQSRAGYFRRAG